PDDGWERPYPQYRRPPPLCYRWWRVLCSTHTLSRHMWRHSGTYTRSPGISAVPSGKCQTCKIVCRRFRFAAVRNQARLSWRSVADTQGRRHESEGCRSIGAWKVGCSDLYRTERVRDVLERGWSRDS